MSLGAPSMMMAALGDTYWSSVQCLLHFNGADNGTVFSEQTGKAVTRYGNAVTSTANSVFGGSSLLLDGSGDYLTLADSAAWKFGTGEFTVEGRFYVSGAISTLMCLASYGSSTNTGWQIFVNGSKLYARFYDSGGVIRALTSITTLVSGRWYYYKYTRVGGVTELYLDGGLEATASHGHSLFVPTNTPYLWIGQDAGTTRYFNGYLDEFRITSGVGRSDTGIPVDEFKGY